ncbi:MAG: FliH/SctL family protein [Balneolaceae bacterium]
MNYDSLFQGTLVESDQDSHESGQSQMITQSEFEELLDRYKKEWAEKQEALLEQEKEKSFQKGYQKGSSQTNKKIQNTSEAVLNAFNEIEKKVNQLMTEVKPQIAEMIFDIAERIIEHPIVNESMHQRVRQQIDRVIDQISDNLNIRVEVSSDEFELIKELLESRMSSEHITLTSSDHLQPGEFIVDTNREKIVKKFKKSLNDFRESVTFTDLEPDDTEK